MERVAVFVDAGYLFAAGAVELVGKTLQRHDLDFNAEQAAAALEQLAVELTGVPLLRIYWYDGTSTGPSPQHLTLAFLPRVKVRLGIVNTYGQQKGVDSLIITDMINLARNRAISDAVLLSGDEDLRVGVQQAQEFGVRVHLLGIRPLRGNQSQYLLQEADSTREWTADDIKPFLSCISTQTVVEVDLETRLQEHFTDYKQLASHLAGQIPETDLEAVVLSFKGGQVPKVLDGRLLAIGGKFFGTAGKLDSSQKQDLREAFRNACEDRHNNVSGLNE